MMTRSFLSRIADKSDVLKSTACLRGVMLGDPHRAENVDDASRLQDLIFAMNQIHISTPSLPVASENVENFGKMDAKPQFKIISPHHILIFEIAEKRQIYNYRFRRHTGRGLVLNVPCITIRRKRSGRPRFFTEPMRWRGGKKNNSRRAGRCRRLEKGRRIPLWDGKRGAYN